VIQLNVRDVSVRRESEGALKASEYRFRLVVDSVRDHAIFQLDADGNIITRNRNAERVLGWRAQEAVGQNGTRVRRSDHG
jgi:PAS domain S-box-containing protein